MKWLSTIIQTTWKKSLLKKKKETLHVHRSHVQSMNRTSIVQKQESLILELSK